MISFFLCFAAPNQQAIPAVEYLMSADGGSAKRFVLLGTDYVYPRTTNKILRAFLHSKGIADADIMESYTPFGHNDYQGIKAEDIPVVAFPVIEQQGEMFFSDAVQDVDTALKTFTEVKISRCNSYLPRSDEMT